MLFTEYRVAEGDTLSVIAKKFGVSVGAIMDANGLTDPNKIALGQKLRIPIVATVSSTAASASSGATTPGTAPGATTAKTTPGVQTSIVTITVVVTIPPSTVKKK